jgi:D-alanyl-D-alanine carboxypeptidase/D-alanyl-D-alanine-endopeptidase (penicillin-binding protein 4)
MGNEIYVRGTIPPNESRFVISGAMLNPAKTLGEALNEYLIGKKIAIQNTVEVRKETPEFKVDYNEKGYFNYDTVYNHYSPVLDSINYWFLKKSVNLYGEALVKTIAKKNNNAFSTDSGIAIIRDFWSKRGIEKAALNIIDGSGLSPANRVTTHALVTVMQYARQQPWFSSFYYDLPETNGIKMKDGYINGVRSYTGYITSKDGNQYTFSFIVNNFDGNPGTVREKMWKLLDILK